VKHRSFETEPARCSRCHRARVPALAGECKILHGWAVVATGMAEAGIAEMREGITHKKELGLKLHLPSFLGLLAGAYSEVGRPHDALVS
jgi:predicted ATPase